jgi:RNA polymerase sigma factor (sigma-70 family)
MHSFPRPDDRTPRTCWPAKKGHPANPAKMPPSPLDPRHSPERPDDAPPQPPTKEDLHKCLRAWLPTVEDYLKRSFPEYTVLDALEKAEAAGLRAIYGDLHDKMKPEEMTSASRQAWLLEVARNAALTVLRRKQPVPLRDDYIPPSASTSSLDPDERELVQEAVRKLPLDAREVIAAYFFKGLSTRSAAAQLGIPAATFRYRLAKAKRQFRSIFQQLCKEF